MVQLQPRLPGRRKKEHHEPEGGHEHKRKSRDMSAAYAVILAAAVVVILVVIVMLYSPQPQQAGNPVTFSQVAAEVSRLAELSKYPRNLNIDAGDYPKVFGTWRNHTLVEQYYCSDVCPDYGRVDLVFQGVDSEGCRAAGGIPMHDLAWGGYIGCGPFIPE